MKRLLVLLFPVVLVMAVLSACGPSPSSGPPGTIANYTCYQSSSGTFDIGTTPIAGFAYGVKDNGLAFTSRNGTCTGPTIKLTLVQATESDPSASQADAGAQCALLGFSTSPSPIFENFPGLPFRVWQC
jgi:hypothetical protein